MLQISPMRSKIRIKKHKNKNDYILASNIWVRDFTKNKIKPIDINSLSSKKDFEIYLNNEIKNIKSKNLFIDSEPSGFSKAVIISDGLNFNTKQLILSKLNYKDVAVIGVNGSLASWQMINEPKRMMNFYFINNPYKEASYFLPKKHRYYPKCIASIRTDHEFISNYNGSIYYYSPVMDQNYSSNLFESSYKIDDYRNPICGAISFSYKLGVNKLLLLCCDDSFEKEKPGSVFVNDAWCYPQQISSNEIIDGCLFWLKNKNINIAYHSSGVKLQNAEYIKYEDIEPFFMEEGS